MLKPATTDIEALKILDERLRWLSAWTIHHANHIRDSADGLKVGGHQASCASMTRDHGRALFPCAGPERPRRGQAARRAGAARDPLSARLADRASSSRISAASAARKAIRAGPRTRSRSISRPARSASASRSRSSPAWCRIISPRTAGWTRQDRGRFVALIGDAELDEGNIYEALIEGAKHDVRNLWWIVDYNRQSLDATSADRMFERFDEIFKSCGWRVVELRYGKRLQAALDATSEAEELVRDAAQRRAVGAPLPGRRGVAGADRGRSRQGRGGVPQGA